MKYPKPMRKKKYNPSRVIPNYQELFMYVYLLWGGMCPIAASLKVYSVNPDQLHHRLHNERKNRIRFPLFINSVFNVVAVSEKYHTENRNWGKYSVFAADKIEQYIIDNRECAEIGYFKSKKELEDCIKGILK